MKKQNQNLLLIIAIALIVGVVLFYTKIAGSTSFPPSQVTEKQTKTFQSENLKFSLNLPAGFTAKDEPSRITIDSDKGKIYVNRNGTQHEDLDNYLKEFDQQTKLNITADEKLTINNYQARSRIFKNTDVTKGQEKIYFIYADNFVYKISTTSESLFDDLDQIAQSFQYTP